MKPSSMHFFTLWAILQIFTACATNESASSTAPSTASAVMQTTSQMRSSDRMFYWLEEPESSMPWHAIEIERRS